VLQGYLVATLIALVWVRALAALCRRIPENFAHIAVPPPAS